MTGAAMADLEQPLAILFADICDSTQLYEINGDKLAHQLVAQTIDQLASITVRQGGTVVKTIGDEIMTTFPNADAAFVAAAKMQEAQRAERLPISSGFHFGPVIRQGSDVFGDAVNVASRVASMAHAGEILMTEDVIRHLSPHYRKQTRLLDKTTVKGKREPINVFRGIWIETDLTAIGTVSAPNPAVAAPLVLTFGGRDYLVSERLARFVLGRSEDADLVVLDAQVSRQHAIVEPKRGNFYLTDCSTNGTYVVPGSGEAVFLKRETIQLLGSGTISLGREPDVNEPRLLGYRRGA